MNSNLHAAKRAKKLLSDIEKELKNYKRMSPEARLRQRNARKETTNDTRENA